MPLITLLIGGIVIYFFDSDSVMLVFLFIHCLNRLILIVLVFYSFRSLPLDTYASLDWLSFIPSFS